MGMQANYQEITDEELERIISDEELNEEELFEEVEELQENDELDLCDIHKMWDSLHFLLTGRSASEPIENNLISEAIVGQFNISGEEMSEYIAGTKSDRVVEIANGLKAIDIEQYIAGFSMEEFGKNDIYPNIWGYEDEEDVIKEELLDIFESLKEFYLSMAEKGKAVVVSIY